MKYGYADVSLKRDLWKGLSEKIGGEFKVRQSQSRSHEKLILTFKYRNVEIQFTENDTQPLKVTFSHLARYKCNVSITGEDLIERIVKRFGIIKEIEVGNPEFDKKYLVQSDDNVLLRKFVSPDIQFLMLETNVYAMTCSTNKKTNDLDYECTVSRQINDIDTLQNVYVLTTLVVDRLEEMQVI